MINIIVHKGSVYHDVFYSITHTQKYYLVDASDWKLFIITRIDYWKLIKHVVVFYATLVFVKVLKDKVSSVDFDDACLLFSSQKWDQSNIVILA